MGQNGEGREVGHGWARRGRESARPKTGIGWIKSFRILFGIWIFGKLWKFAKGDSDGILPWGFFLKSSRLLKDF
jgi:hypothetical protein